MDSRSRQNASSAKPVRHNVEVPRPAVEALEGRRLLSAAVGLTVDDALVLFDTERPSQIIDRERVSGLQPGESLVGIDYRPATGQLYGVGKTGDIGRLYTLNPLSGLATFVAQVNVPLSGGAFGVDFNPAVDRLRVVSDADQNLRINPDTGMVADNSPATPGVQPDGNLAYAAGDVNAGRDPNVVGAAYTNNDGDPATATTLYDIDASQDVLVTQTPPNAGTLNTVGPLMFNTSQLVGFDIETNAGVNTAYASLTTNGSSGSKLFRIDLASGEATKIGNIGSGGRDGRVRLSDLAIAPPGTTFAAGVHSGNDRLFNDSDDDGRDNQDADDDKHRPGHRRA